MARENLPTNYVNYELATAMGGMRRFNQINNSDGTISFEDATTYSVTGTTYGANEINTTNALINEINELVGTTSISGSGQTDITSLLGGTDITNATLGIGDGTVTGAISEINSNLSELTSSKSNVLTTTLTHKNVTFTTSDTSWNMSATLSGYTPLLYSLYHAFSSMLILQAENVSRSSGSFSISGFGRVIEGSTNLNTYMTLIVLWVKND